MAAYLMRKETVKLRLLLDKIYFVISFSITFFYLLFYSQLKNTIKQENIRESFPDGILMLCGGVVVFLLLLMVIQITRYYMIKKADCLLLIFFSTILSIGCLIVVPAIPARLFLPLVILTNILNIDIIVSFILMISTEKKRMKAGIAAVLVLAVLCIPNMYQIYNGYSENAQVWKRNQKRMEEITVRREQGENVNEVFLEKLPNKEYSGEMLYFGTADYMKFWICNFYDLPYDFELYYK